MVLLLNSFGSSNFILIYDQFLLAKGACVGIVPCIIYMSIVKNSIDSPTQNLAFLPLLY